MSNHRAILESLGFCGTMSSPSYSVVVYTCNYAGRLIKDMNTGEIICLEIPDFLVKLLDGSWITYNDKT